MRYYSYQNLPNQNSHIDFNSEETLFSFMRSYYSELFRYGIKFTGNVEETKDALNQFFIHLWENKQKLEGVTDHKAYIFVAYKRWLIAHLRERQKRNIVFSDEELLQSTEQSYEEYLVKIHADKEWADTLAAAIADLSRRQKQLIQLRFFEHLSYEEIANRTSLSVRTIYNKLHEGLKKLRENDILLKKRRQQF